MSAEFVARMEDVLDLYAEPYDPKRPVVCFDETSKQLVSEKRSPIPAKAGRRERFDYEYQRNGTRNLFMTCEPLAGWRHVAVTGRRTMTDFAHQMRWLADAARRLSPALQRSNGKQPHPTLRAVSTVTPGHRASAQSSRRRYGVRDFSRGSRQTLPGRGR